VKVIILILALLCIGAPVALYVSSKPAVIAVDPVKYIGNETPVNVRVVSPHGIRQLTVEIQQDGKGYSATHVETSARRFMIERHAPPVSFTSTVGRRKMPALHDGKARIVVTAVANDLRALTEVKFLDVDVMTAPPTVSADGVQHYINQGGSEMVTFTPGGAWAEAGVKVGDYTFRSFPCPAIRASTSACSRSPGNSVRKLQCGSTPPILPARRPGPISGTRFSRSNSTPAPFVSRT